MDVDEPEHLTEDSDAMEVDEADDVPALDVRTLDRDSDALGEDLLDVERLLLGVELILAGYPDIVIRAFETSLLLTRIFKKCSGIGRQLLRRLLQSPSFLTLLIRGYLLLE